MAWSREHDESFRIGHLKSNFVVHDDLIFEFSLVDILLPSLASGADDWAISRAIASKQTTNVKKEDQIFKFNVLQTLTLNVQF